MFHAIFFLPSRACVLSYRKALLAIFGPGATRNHSVGGTYLQLLDKLTSALSLVTVHAFNCWTSSSTSFPSITSPWSSSSPIRRPRQRERNLKKVHTRGRLLYTPPPRRRPPTLIRLRAPLFFVICARVSFAFLCLRRPKLPRPPPADVGCKPGWIISAYRRAAGTTATIPVRRSPQSRGTRT